MAVRIEPRAEPIPGYKLIERLGGGGFGEVWKAEAPGGLLKAIKFVFGDLKKAGDDSQRAEQELKAMARVKSVRHPYILSLERYDIIDGQLMIVMELADRNLWDRFKECRAQGLEGIPRDELLRYMEESAEGLDLMNSQYQLQHLDIKPQNIFLIGDHIKVADFGLAKDLEGTHASVTGGVTPVYAAPETFDGIVTRFCDQYSLAIVYQELLTGRRPFNGVNVRQLILQHLQAVPDVSPLPPADQPVIARALSKSSNDRFAMCRDMVKLLRQNTHLPRTTAAAADVVARSGDRATTSSNGHAVQTVVESRHNRGSPEGQSADVPEGPEASGGRQHPVGSPGDAGTGNCSTPVGRVPVQTEDSAEGTTQLLRTIERVARFEGQPDRAQFTEIKGEGTLFPALLLAVGQTGLTMMQRLREILVDRFESLERLPHLRMLLLDTDPETARQATRSRVPEVSASGAAVPRASCAAALAPSEVLLTGLNRPSYYLKPREGKAAITWLNQRMLYRIPRSQVTTGVRALGRLAYCDHYRAIHRRLQSELSACLDQSALTRVAQQTRLGLRTNRPRVYILCGLAGGTGSGMFLDLAYTVRALLKGLGFEQPDIVGLLFLPALESHQTKALAVGNAHAALTELNHFSTPGARFQAQYLDRDVSVTASAPRAMTEGSVSASVLRATPRGGASLPPATCIEECDPPFSRYFLLPLPEETDEVSNRELADLAGQFLYRDLCTPLGQAADLARAELPSPPWAARGQFYQTFGLYPLTWPRPALCRRSARRLCGMLVQRWLSKDSKLLREPIQQWVREQWTQQGLGAERFITELREKCQEELTRPPETIFQSLLEPLLARGTVAPENRRSGAAAVELAPEEIHDVLMQIEGWTGKPEEDKMTGATSSTSSEPGRLIEILKVAGESTTSAATQRLAELVVRLIEEPSYRLAGAEEAIRQLIAQVEEVLQRQEPLTRELTANAEQAHARLQALLHPPKGQRRPSLSARDVVELLRTYAKNRFQSQLLVQVSAAYVSLRGHLSDQLREVGFCRTRLSELLRQLENGGSNVFRPVIGKQLFLSGCHNLDEAVEQILAAVTPELLLELDGAVEEMITQKFTALVTICLSNNNILKNVEQEMLETGRQFAERLLTQTDAAQIFLEQEPEAAQRCDEVSRFHDEATPELTPRGGLAGEPATPVEKLTILAAPSGEAGNSIRELAHTALADVEIHPAASADDVLFYRETANLPLSALPHLGPTGKLIYRQMTAADNFTPHTRIDIKWKDEG